MWSKVLFYTSFSVVLGFASEGIAGDLQDALSFVSSNSNRGLVSQYDQVKKKEQPSLMGLLEARDIVEGKELEEYDCIQDGRMDRFWQPKYGKGDFRLMARYCVEQQFKNKNVRGYRTLGNIQLSARQVESVIRQASDAVDVPAVIVREIITLSSGFRPGAIADNGRVGLMQLKPSVARQFGANNPLDAAQNIFAGARYLAHLLDKWDNVLPLALAEFKGADTSILAKGTVPKDRELIWWVRAITKQYQAESMEFPVDLGWESIAVVSGWLH